MDEKVCKCGTTQSAGCYCCTNCGQEVNLDDGQTLPPCPRCNNRTFTKK